MKILFDYSIFLKQSYGGISKYILNLADNLKKIKIQTEIFSPITLSCNFLQQHNYIYYVNLKRIPKFFTKILNFFNYFLTYIYIFIKRPNLIHVTYHENLYNFLNIPVVVTVYDLIYEKFYNILNKKKILERASHIICISKNTQKDLFRYYNIDKSKVSVIYLGVSGNTYYKNSKKNQILYVGDREGYKNFDKFIVAFSRSKFLKKNYKILCFGLKNFSIKEIETFKKLKINSLITFKTGNDKLLYTSYRESKLFVNPSGYEGFGLTSLEAMQNSCPVIANNIKVFKEVFKSACYYSNVQNIVEFSSAIEKILKSKSIQKTLINSGHKIVQNYQWKDCAEKTKNIYQKLIK
jgi:glycosyltransferase involved in cell wall biosynthesis